MAAGFGKREAFGRRPVETPAARPQARATQAVPAAITQDGGPAALPSKWPLLTITLSVVLATIFCIQTTFGLEPGQPLAFDLRTATAWGGIDRYLVIDQHEWWRIFTAPWLHASLDHLVGNLITLGIAGTILERRIGAAWLAAVYFAGGLAGSIGSILLGNPTIVSIGASGAIMALVTALYALSYHASLERNARRLRRFALFVVVPAVVPSAAHSAMQIDVGAHFGGFVAGLAVAFLLLVVWGENQPAPGWRTPARGVAGFGVAAALACFALVVLHYPSYAARSAALVPLSRYHDEGTLVRDAYNLSLRYPHDPGLRMVLAADSLTHRYYADAESQARKGLEERDMLVTEFGPPVEQRLHLLLALALVSQHRQEEAKEAVQPACELVNDNAALADDFHHLGLCV